MTTRDVSYRFADGQLVRDYCDRPESAWRIDAIPTGEARTFCEWNDANGEWADASHNDLMLVILDWYQDALCEELTGYCEAHGLPRRTSADEIQVDPRDPLAASHTAWLADYVARWDEMVDLRYVYARG
jgi:hypothetical protein